MGTANDNVVCFVLREILSLYDLVDVISAALEDDVGVSGEPVARVGHVSRFVVAPPISIGTAALVSICLLIRKVECSGV